MSTIRQEQIQGRLVEEISVMLRRDLRDPRLSRVTVTEAAVSRDLRYAKVYVTVLGPAEEAPAIVDSLQRAAGYLRGEFARRAHLRFAPELEFRLDEGIDRGARIFELLHSVEEDLQKPE